MHIKGKKALVLGAGKSGVEAARFLALRGAKVTLHDNRDVESWSETARSLKTTHNVDLMSGQLPTDVSQNTVLVVISPGVPVALLPIAYLGNGSCELIGEVELAYRFLKGRIAGITGSNGKTTTTALMGELLKNAGIKTQVGGNIGTPLLSLIETSTEDCWTVVELSSYQLETIRHLRPAVAICLNVTPNHLDRYESFEGYASAKRRLFINQTGEDVAILNADDEITASWAPDLKANVVMFSVRRELEDGLFLRGNDLVCRSNGKDRVLTTRGEIFLRGLHNVENVLAAFAAGLACGASPESMRKTVSEFKGVEHRIEYVDEVDSVRFYNDSKATSVDATSKALEALSGGDGRTILILGGRGKKAPYAPLKDLINSSVRALVLVGEDADNIESQLSGTAPIIRAGSMEDAVRRGFDAALSGDAVLLAPACASFDMFKSFEQRGDVFKAAVVALRDSRGPSAAAVGTPLS